MRFDRTPYANCAECPLNRKRKVWGTSDIDDPLIAMFGEAPGAEEDNRGVPFVGAAGSLLTKGCVRASIQRRNAWVSNVIACRPPDNDITSAEALEAIACCKPGLQAELERVAKTARVVLALGATPMRELLGETTGITKRRGSVYELRVGRKTLPAIPTFHPSFLLHGAMKEEPTFIQDLIKARELSTMKWKPPKELFNLEPTLGDLELLVQRTKGKLIGCDIEATGLNPSTAEVIMVGVAESPERATVIPFLAQHHRQYWKPKDLKTALHLTKTVLLGAKLVMQNASYDVPILRKFLDAPGLRPAHDTILAHHAIHPELPHNLGYIVSLYGSTPFWKGEVQGRSFSSMVLEDRTFRTYNARDAVVLLQVLPGLLNDLKTQKTETTYGISLGLLEPTVEMTAVGLPLDQNRLRTWASKLRRQQAKLRKDIYESFELPATFKVGSEQHLDLLFYGKVANRMLKAKDDLVAYDLEGSKKRRDTKKYAAMVVDAELPSRVHRLRLPESHRPHMTKGGAYSYDKLAMVKMSVSIANRLSLLDALLRPRPEHLHEREGLLETRRFIGLHREFSKVSKLVSTYTNFPVWADGRVHPKYKIIGTTTGRLASGSESELVTDDDKLNAQNIPEEARRLFVAPEGHVFVGADYSNLELRILALVSGDAVLQDIFDRGLNAHDVLTQELFGITKDDPMWGVCRRAEKTIIFGYSYGGGLGTLLDNVTAAVPELGLTMAQLRNVMDNYAAKHPAYFAWRKAVLSETFRVVPPMLRNDFGRVRIFLGRPLDVERAALDFKMQSNAADIINTALIEMWAERNRLRMHSRFVGQIHDALLMLGPKNEAAEMAMLLRSHMEQPFTINKKRCVFPVEVSMGPSWGEMEKLDGQEKTAHRRKTATNATAPAHR